MVAAKQRVEELTTGLASANASLVELHAEFNTRNSETAQWIEELIAAAAEKSNANLAQIQEKLGAATRQIEALKASANGNGEETAQ